MSMMKSAIAKKQQQNPQHNIKQMTTCQLDKSKILTAGKLSFDLVNLIQQQIQNDQFQVSQIKKDFKLRNNNNSQQSNHREMHKLLKQKQQMQNQLNHIQLEQRQHHIRQNSVVSSYTQNRYFKSEMTQEQIDKIKKIRLMQKKYQIDLENKTRAYQQNLKRFQEEEKQLLENQKRQRNQQRLKEVARSIEQIRIRQQQRTKKLEEEKKKLIQIKAEKKLYQKLDERQKQIQMLQQKKRQQIKQALKQQKILKVDDIKQHEMKYDNIMRIQKQERQRKLGQLSKSTNKKYFHHQLLGQIIEKQQKVKILHIQKKNAIKQKLLKKEQYAEYVKNNYKPTMRQDIQQKEKKQPVVRSMSVAELNRIGNQYMKKVNEDLASSKVNVEVKVLEKKEPFKYKDYLKEIKAQRKISSQSNSRYLQQIDSLMKKQNMTQQQKFIKAKQITQKLQINKEKDSQKIIDSINAKIYLLKQIQPTQ